MGNKLQYRADISTEWIFAISTKATSAIPLQLGVVAQHGSRTSECQLSILGVTERFSVILPEKRSECSVYDVRRASFYGRKSIYIVLNVLFSITDL